MSTTNHTERLLLRLEVEDFLYAEAALLDAWELDAWLALFTEDAQYVVPSTDRPEGDPRTDLTLIDDDYLRLTWRVRRLKSRHAHREYPWSRTRRLISNVRVLAADGDTLTVEATQLVHRFRYGHADVFSGVLKLTLLRTPEGLRITHRRAEVDLERLAPNGALSMIF